MKLTNYFDRYVWNNTCVFPGVTLNLKISDYRLIIQSGTVIIFAFLKLYLLTTINLKLFRFVVMDSRKFWILFKMNCVFQNLDMLFTESKLNSLLTSKTCVDDSQCGLLDCKSVCLKDAGYCSKRVNDNIEVSLNWITKMTWSLGFLQEFNWPHFQQFLVKGEQIFGRL